MGFRYKREHILTTGRPARRRAAGTAGVLTRRSARFLVLILSSAMLAGTGAVPAKDGTGVVWADEIPAGSDAPGVIRYSDLPELVKAYSPQVEMERIQYEGRLGRYESAREDIMETRRLLREEADDMEENGDTEGAKSYRAQAKILEDAAKDIDKQIRSAKGSSSTMSLRKMEDTMIWTAQSLMGLTTVSGQSRKAPLQKPSLCRGNTRKQCVRPALEWYPRQRRMRRERQQQRQPTRHSPFRMIWSVSGRNF